MTCQGQPFCSPTQAFSKKALYPRVNRPQWDNACCEITGWKRAVRTSRSTAHELAPNFTSWTFFTHCIYMILVLCTHQAEIQIPSFLSGLILLSTHIIWVMTLDNNSQQRKDNRNISAVVWNTVTWCEKKTFYTLDLLLFLRNLKWKVFIEAIALCWSRISSLIFEMNYSHRIPCLKQTLGTHRGERTGEEGGEEEERREGWERKVVWIWINSQLCVTAIISHLSCFLCTNITIHRKWEWELEMNQISEIIYLNWKLGSYWQIKISSMNNVFF